MAVVFPSGINPFVFSDTLPGGSTDTSSGVLDQHINAFTVADVNAAVPPDAATLFLTFVVFGYPDPPIQASVPKRPIVEVLRQGAGFDGRGAALQLTANGTAALDLGGGQFLNYTYRSLGGGVFQAVFSPNTTPLPAIDWRIRFTINDGATGAASMTGLTLSVGTADTRFPWLALPGQGVLTTDGPPPFDLTGIGLVTLGAPRPVDTAIAGGGVWASVMPIGNYGTGPLTVTSAQITPADGPISTDFARWAPTVIAPGRWARVGLRLYYDMPAAGGPARAVVTVATDDPLAGPAGKAAHFDAMPLVGQCLPTHLMPVPNTLGLTASQAQATIRKAGFVARTLGKADGAGKGVCVLQRPSAGNRDSKGTRVLIWISAPGLSNGQVLGDDLLGTGVAMPDDLP